MMGKAARVFVPWTLSICVGVSLQLWARSTAVLITCLGSTLMLRHCHMCPTKFVLLWKPVLRVQCVSPLPGSHYWQVTFLKVMQAQSEIRASCLLQLRAAAGDVGFLPGKSEGGGWGRAANFPARSTTACERKIQEEEKKTSITTSQNETVLQRQALLV